MTTTDDITTEALEATDTDDVAESSADLAFRIDKFRLQAVLEQASSVLPSRDVMPVLKNFQVEVEPVEGVLRCVATDLVLSVVTSTQMVTIERGGSAVFPGKKLLDIVKEAEEGDFVVDVKDGTAHIEVGKAKWTLKLMNGDEYPDIPETDSLTWYKISRAKLLDALDKVRYAASSETTRPTLMLIDITDGKVRAADGVRFQQVDLGTDVFPLDMQIPIGAVENLVRLMRMTEVPDIEAAESDNFLVFRIAGNVYIASKSNSQFPEVDEILLKPALANDKDLHVDRAELEKAIKRVRINADAETSAVVFALATNELTVKAKDKYGNDSAETLNVKWESGDREVAFNHVHLLEMLKMTDVKSCHFLLGEDTKTRRSPLLLKDEPSGLIGTLNQIRIDFIQ